MNRIILTVGSVTYAMKAKKILAAAGIAAKPIKVDENLSKNGCTYGVEISYNDFYGAVNELKRKNIEYSVYKS